MPKSTNTMLHFAGVPEYSPAHVMLMASIGKALQERGHRCTLFQRADALAWAASENIGLCSLDSDSATSRGKGISDHLAFLCRSLPAAMAKAGVDCVLTDPYMPAGASVAEAFGIPFITVAPAMPINGEPNIPPPFVPWRYSSSSTGRLRNRVAYTARDLFLKPAVSVLNQFRTQHGLPVYKTPGDSLSRLAQISPLIREFDFPRTELPCCFHYVGPYLRDDPPAVSFPYERLTGQPVVYFTCGTVSPFQNDVLRGLILATKQLGAQLVVSAGNKNPTPTPVDLPRHVIHVGYAPQRSLLQFVNVFVTHCGMNSVLESLLAGVPLLAVPKLRLDHPGVAARIAHHKVGIVLSQSERKNPARLRLALEQLLHDPEYRTNVQRFQQLMRASGGASAAAAIIEKAATTCVPVEAPQFATC